MARFRTWILVAGLTSVLAACFVVPVRDPDGNVYCEPYPLPPSGSPLPQGAGMAPAAASTMPTVLSARLYPANELASQTGVVTGAVTNMMTGKGRFTVNYQGEVLAGEATRVSNEERRGVASAYGNKGTYISCEYQLTTAVQGTGECTFSNGAVYKLHLGGN